MHDIPDAPVADKICPSCFAVLQPKLNESKNRFLGRTYCGRACATRSTAKKAIATKKRALLRR